MQTDNILSLVDNDFAGIEKDTIRLAKIMRKEREFSILIHLLKFTSAQIKLDLNGIVLIKKSYIKEIFLVTDHVADFTSFIDITRKKIWHKKQYLVQKASDAYIRSMY